VLASHPVTKNKRARGTDRHLELARKVVHEGQSFRKAAVSVGYSQRSANNGPSVLSARIPGLGDAFTKVALETVWRPEHRRSLAIHRIVKTCADDKNSDNLKAAELIGRMKDVDLFVRNGDAQVGIFFGAVEASDADIASLELPAANTAQDNSDSHSGDSSTDRPRAK